MFYIPNLSSPAKQELQWSKHQLKKTWAKRIATISNHTLTSLVITQGTHWQEMHMHRTVERVLEPGSWVLTGCWILTLAAQYSMSLIFLFFKNKIGNQVQTF